ncbi:zf-HC2 domain-containing protein [Streptomyces sp. NRRL B-3648]|uniref:zf-HC2 domain-containing protein n=1 Tax=Streptomyces sp. NRRL B-3648 TaxID=1519493 RepID=UPI0006ADEAD4|nr:zf-HC2 domain-containing protein [Streptomyces sp. NRRL B-3648]KOV92227.1 membrane protein [Streptomyces sp. NRRL B-3648]
MTHRNAHLWHASEDLVARYAEGVLPEPDAWSLEKHVEGCAGCASRVSAAVRGTAAGAVLAQVRAAVLESAPAPESAPALVAAGAPGSAGATGVTGWRAPSRIARLLWAAGPAVRGAWLPAVLGVAVAALALSYGAGFPGARALLLAVAPVVPVAGVALSYGPHADPLHEVTAATPAGGLRLALTRTVAVLVVSLPLLTLAGLLLPASGAPAAAAWLLPGLALALASLALASFVGCRAAAGVTGGGWLCAVLPPVAVAPGGAVTARLADQLSRCLDGTAAQAGWAAAAVLSAALLTARRPAYDRPLRP